MSHSCLQNSLSISQLRPRPRVAIPRDISKGADATNDEEVGSHIGGYSFLDLPGVIRNEIYLLVAGYQIQHTDSRACEMIKLDKEWNRRKKTRLMEKGNPHLMVLQPGLFLTCKRIWREALPFFYQEHKFRFHQQRKIWCGSGHWLHGEEEYHHWSFEFGTYSFTKWFQAIGHLGHQHLRDLRFYNAPMPKSMRFHKRIHQKLTENATVVYTAQHKYVASKHWKMAIKYQGKDPEKVPLLHRARGDPKFLEFWDEDDAKPPFSLVFQPRSGWFGMAHDDQAQIYWRWKKHNPDPVVDKAYYLCGQRL